MKVSFFPTAIHFRLWLIENHDKTDVLWLGFYKKSTGIESIDWPESVDEALCYGWIDGLRKRIDEKSYKIRFTPRRPKSHWSTVNISRVKELKKAGRMMEAGLAAIEKRSEKNSKSASYQQKSIQLDPIYVNQFESATEAWNYFKSKSPTYQKQCIWWIMSAKKKETKKRRLNVLLDSCNEGKLIPPLRWTEKKKN